MSKTRRDLALRALSRLGKVATGQMPAPEDMQIALDGIDPLLAELRVRKVFYTSNPDETPDEAFNPLAALLANSIAEEFEISPEAVQAWAARAAQAESRLLEMLDDTDDEAPVRATYY